MDNDRNTLSTLNKLIETCKDGEYGFQSCAEHVNSAELRSLFTARASDCRQAATELQALVRQHGGEPEDSGSATGAMHRGWVAVKGTLAGYSDLAMLEECERGEDAALERYREALEEDLPPQVRMVVERQFEGVKRNHMQVRTLRDQARAAHD
ncbi:MAG: PA2169 family four-helix-bundle protein [Burkholderiales bacterium]|nr:PA2169 family four-helix-bundle protein [Burkholderiales bacterium]